MRGVSGEKRGGGASGQFLSVGTSDVQVLHVNKNILQCKIQWM